MMFRTLVRFAPLGVAATAAAIRSRGLTNAPHVRPTVPTRTLDTFEGPSYARSFSIYDELDRRPPEQWTEAFLDSLPRHLVLKEDFVGTAICHHSWEIAEKIAAWCVARGIPIDQPMTHMPHRTPLHQALLDGREKGVE